LLPVGITGVGAAYAVALSFRSGTVDPRAPFVAAGLFLAAECAYWSLGSSAGRPDRRTVARRLLLACAGAVAAALVGALVLVAASDSTRGVAFEAVGVAAALAILLLVAAISSRTKIRS
jgi:peptidoglycan/LPS O-acetylase OafA/YrhL